MTPALRHDLLFDDILYLELVKHEHEAFRQLLSVIVPPASMARTRGSRSALTGRSL